MVHFERKHSQKYDTTTVIFKLLSNCMTCFQICVRDLNVNMVHAAKQVNASVPLIVKDREMNLCVRPI